jgi:hypothetical protein
VNDGAWMMLYTSAEAAREIVTVTKLLKGK